MRLPRRCATRPRRCPRSKGSHSSPRRSSRTWSASYQSCSSKRGSLPVTASAQPVPDRSPDAAAMREPGTLEEGQVQAMFDRISGLYDPMNTVMTVGLHHHWRRRAADLTGCSAGSRALDIACGTGDLAIELAARVAPGGEVVGCDFSERMLSVARAKAPEIRFDLANAL